MLNCVSDSCRRFSVGRRLRLTFFIDITVVPLEIATVDKPLDRSRRDRLDSSSRKLSRPDKIGDADVTRLPAGDGEWIVLSLRVQNFLARTGSRTQGHGFEIQRDQPRRQSFVGLLVIRIGLSPVE
jgi:hypothetical protein